MTEQSFRLFCHWRLIINFAAITVIPHPLKLVGGVIGNLNRTIILL